MHAGLGAQPAVGIFTLHRHGGALDAGDLAWTRIDDLAREAVRGAPAKIHAQQHLGPVLGLGTAGTGLDVEERAVRVHLTGEHALEFELANPGLELTGIALDLERSGFV